MRDAELRGGAVGCTMMAGCTLIFGGGALLGYLLGSWRGVEVAGAAFLVLIGFALVWAAVNSPE